MPTTKTSYRLSLLASLQRLLDKRRSRAALLEIGDDQLDDIGLSRFEVVREANRRFWE